MITGHDEYPKKGMLECGGVFEKKYFRLFFIRKDYFN